MTTQDCKVLYLSLPVLIVDVSMSMYNAHYLNDAVEGVVYVLVAQPEFSTIKQPVQEH